MQRPLYVRFLRSLLALAIPAMLASAVHTGALAQTAIPLTDSLYQAHHPRLLLTPDEIPALRLKLQDGGADDLQYLFILVVLEVVYKQATELELLDDDYGLEAFVNLGLTMYLPPSPDPASESIGKSLTQYVADNWAVGNDGYHSSLRLRALAMGYDMFFGNATEAERAQIRDEIRSYLDYMLNDINFDIWRHRPYLGNKSAMVAAALGLAAIVLDGETDAAIVTAGLQSADERFNIWLDHQVDKDGACMEGTLYGAWSLRNLIYYFHARLRYDGVNYANVPKLRKMEEWFAYELDPAGGGKVNNIQDCATTDLVLARHTTYFDWAQSAWNSPLSKYIWDHVAGPYGYNYGDKADKAGTILWSRGVPSANPRTLLPKCNVWEERGLYYYRSDWADGAASNDVMFSFYSGKFQGGHAQEDQNQFTLTAYGVKLAVDHGPGSTAKESEAHNIVFIDGNGQHNAGSAIGTDGQITEYVLGGYADYVAGDATSAYTTYSPFNRAGFPYPGSDWSWGYSGANPVNTATRRVVAVHEPATRPYFIVIDDIDKDGGVHDYEWRLHTAEGNTVDVSTDPVRITKDNTYLEVRALSPPFDSLATSVTFFDNHENDPNSSYVSFSRSAVDPGFAFLLFPGDNSFTAPVVNVSRPAFGVIAALAWGGGKGDVFLLNKSGQPVVTMLAAPSSRARDGDAAAPGTQAAGNLSTDASVSLLRRDGAVLEQYLLSGVTYLTLGGIDYVTINDGPANVTMSPGRIDIDRPNADFRFFAPAVMDVFYRDQRIFVVENAGYLTPSPATGIGDMPRPRNAIGLAAHPNPFNPATRITVTLKVRGDAVVDIFNVRGQRVRRLWKGRLAAGASSLDWDGRDGRGRRVASGVYLVRAKAGAGVATAKLTLLK
ncbi:MAG: FlgD immunoglobulin-like domain containing protein [Candidatus Krumholzibacteriia bacterium]